MKLKCVMICKNSDMVEHELEVTSCELQVTNYEFKSTSLTG